MSANLINYSFLIFIISSFIVTSSCSSVSPPDGDDIRQTADVIMRAKNTFLILLPFPMFLSYEIRRSPATDQTKFTNSS